MPGSIFLEDAIRQGPGQGPVGHPHQNADGDHTGHQHGGNDRRLGPGEVFQCVLDDAQGLFGLGLVHGGG